jgi:sugar lactone lactonase YvrE
MPLSAKPFRPSDALKQTLIQGLAISPDGETLFFTSTRDGGFGSNDIYVTTRTKHRIR